jgi:hypothetical protein
MPREPSAGLGLLVGGVGVEDGMDPSAGRHCGLDLIQEVKEFLAATHSAAIRPLHAPAERAAIRRVECGKERCGAAADVAVT